MPRLTRRQTGSVTEIADDDVVTLSKPRRAWPTLALVVAGAAGLLSGGGLAVLLVHDGSECSRDAEAPDVFVILEPTVSDGQAEALGDQLEHDSRVRSIQFVDQWQALQNYLATFTAEPANFAIDRELVAEMQPSVRLFLNDLEERDAVLSDIEQLEGIVSVSQEVGPAHYPAAPTAPVDTC